MAAAAEVAERGTAHCLERIAGTCGMQQGPVSDGWESFFNQLFKEHSIMIALINLRG